MAERSNDDDKVAATVPAVADVADVADGAVVVVTSASVTALPLRQFWSLSDRLRSSSRRLEECSDLDGGRLGAAPGVGRSETADDEEFGAASGAD
jgi:hypothetical protein